MHELRSKVWQRTYTTTCCFRHESRYAVTTTRQDVDINRVRILRPRHNIGRLWVYIYRGSDIVNYYFISTVLDSAAGLPCAAARVFECPPGAVGYRESSVCLPCPLAPKGRHGPLVSRDRGAAMALRGPLCGAELRRSDSRGVTVRSKPFPSSPRV